MIYVAMFFCSVIFAYMAEKSSVNNRKQAIIFSVIAILIPSFLAGCRDASVGTDILAYVVGHFEVAQMADSLYSYLPLIFSKEPLYLVLVYFVAKIANNFQVLLFIFSLINISCIYFGAYRLREKIPVHYFMMIYYLMYYNDTYNTVRQHIAMSIIFLGIVYLLEGCYKKFIPYVAIASLFHYTAILSFSFIIIHYFLKSNVLQKKKIVKKILIVACVIIICLFPQHVATYAINLLGLNERYYEYFFNNSLTNSILLTLMYIAEVMLVLMFSSVLKKGVVSFDYLQLNALMCLCLLQLSQVMFYGQRISAYYAIVNLILICQLPKIGKRKIDQRIIQILTIFVMFVYWYYIYVYGEASHTYPYIFAR